MEGWLREISFRVLFVLFLAMGQTSFKMEYDDLEPWFEFWVLFSITALVATAALRLLCRRWPP